MRRLLPVVTLALALTACGTPDRWHPPPPAPTPGAPDPTPPPAAEPVAIQAEDRPTLRTDAEGRLALRVEDAVLLAMAHNRDLRVRRYDPTIAATFEAIERGVYDPEVYASLELERERASETDRGTGERFSVDGEAERAELGLRQRLPTGTDLELSAAQERETSDRTPDQQESRLGLTVTQALLRGFGPQVNLAEIRQAALDTRISRFELQAFAEALVAETETAYWRLVLAQRRIAIVEESLRVAEAERDATAERIAVGAAPTSAAAVTRTEVARREQALIDARSDLVVRRLRLLRLVTPGADLDFDRPIAPLSDAAITPEPLAELPERIRLAQAQRPELGEARTRLEQRRLATVVTANGLLPRLDFFVDLGKTGYGETFGDAVDAIDGDTWDLTVGVDFSYRLGDRSAAARDLAAIASREQARAAIANLEQLVELEVRLAWNEADRAARQIAASATTATLQAETLGAEEARLEAGAGTQLLVAQTQRDLLAAQVAELEAAIAYRLALVDLYRAEGTLLARRGLWLGD